jgi:hypothetical protein
LICKVFDIKILRTLFTNMLIFTRMFIGFREKRGGGGTLREALQSGNMPLSLGARQNLFATERLCKLLPAVGATFSYYLRALTHRIPAN